MALPIFSSDPLSSVAYATEAALVVIVSASAVHRAIVFAITVAIAALLAVVAVSYTRIVREYSSSGGAYVVARDNLGTLPALVAGAALFVDYVLTVAVSVAAGTLALASAVPELGGVQLELALGFVGALAPANLRGVREAGMAFALPTPPRCVDRRAALLRATRSQRVAQAPQSGLAHARCMSKITELPGLSVVLPCFDEEANVADAVREALRAGASVAREAEVIVVDDGSRDNTRAIALELEATNPAVRVVMHETNLGYGAALRSGIAVASKPWILLTDADLQFDLADLEDFVPFTRDYDMLLGWRVQRMDPPGRRIAARAWNALVDAVFAIDVRDVDCAFKLVRSELVQDLPLSASGAMISTEIVVRGLARGARIKEIGVHHRPRRAGHQSGTNPRVVARALSELVAARRQLGTLRHVHP